jgi:hypothetical protein
LSLKQVDGYEDWLDYKEDQAAPADVAKEVVPAPADEAVSAEEPVAETQDVPDDETATKEDTAAE